MSKDLTKIIFYAEDEQQEAVGASQGRTTINGLNHHYQEILKLSCFLIVLSETCCKPEKLNIQVWYVK